jgi:hypothetical protein
LKKKIITYEGPEDAKEAKYDDDADEGSFEQHKWHKSGSVHECVKAGRWTSQWTTGFEGSRTSFVWSLFCDDWQKHYLELKEEYKEEHGHCKRKYLRCRTQVAVLSSMLVYS